jgi:hypothetical protein
MEQGGSAIGAARDDVAERRRFAPSPPCLPFGSPPPDGAAAWNSFDDDRRKRLLESLAAAIDAIHGFRIAHGSLDGDSIFVSAESRVWLADVGMNWAPTNGGGSPRERDLALFRRECERLLGPSLQTGVGRTCKGMLRSWREPPPVPVTLLRNGRARPQKTIKPETQRSKVRTPVPWRTVFVVLLIGSVVGLVAAWQLTPLPRYAMRSLRWTFRKLPESVRVALDPAGTFDPFGKRLIDQNVNDRWARLEMQLGMQRREAIVEVMTDPSERHAELFRRYVKANDSGYYSTLTALFAYPGGWTERAVPRLKETLGEKLPAAGRRTLEYCLLRAAGPDDLPAVENILASATHPDTVADAYESLARLGKRQPIERLQEAVKNAVGAGATTYVATVMHHYPQDEAVRFLSQYAASTRHRTVAHAWLEFLKVVDNSLPRNRIRAAAVFERMLLDSIPKSLAAEGPTADADLLTTLLCLWRLQDGSPDALLERLSAPTPQGQQLRRRLQSMLIGSATDKPERLTLPDEWEIPDEWFAAILADADFYPQPFVQDTIFNSLKYVGTLQQQSRLLALSNLRPETARQALAEHVGAKLDLKGEEWRTHEPLLVSSSCFLLASARTASADARLKNFFEPGPLGREPVAWDGLLSGAIVDPIRHRAVLEAAARHPLPTIWTRARQLLALADGDARRFRNPDRSKPALQQSLAALVEQLERAETEAQVNVILSRQRDHQTAELALGLTASPGATALLHSRMDRRESYHSTYLMLANQPIALSRSKFEDFLRTEHPFQSVEPYVMVGHVLRDDVRSLATIRAVAVGPRGGKNAPPLLHRCVAMYAFGSLQSGDAAPEAVDEILSVIDRDASTIVGHTAAAAALRCVRPEDKKKLAEFAARRPKLPPEIVRVLKLADKL